MTTEIFCLIWHEIYYCALKDIPMGIFILFQVTQSNPATLISMPPIKMENITDRIISITYKGMSA